MLEMVSSAELKSSWCKKHLANLPYSLSFLTLSSVSAVVSDIAFLV